MTSRMRALAAAAACLLAMGCGRPAPVPPRLNLVLVLVDTLRADHLSLYGYERKTSPAIDRFARQNVWFTDTRSQAACTFPSVNSLLASRSAASFLGRAEGDLGIPADLPVLPEVLAAAGYETQAVSASPIVRVAPSRFNRTGGFGRGFADFDDSCIWQDARCVNRQAAAFLERRRERPFFLYLHYLDPHGPYAPPAVAEHRFAVDDPGLPDWVRRGDPNVLARELYEEHRPAERIDRRELAALVDRYDDEIRFFDGQFGELLRTLGKDGLAERTVVALVADHGEQFLEHGGLKHCRSVFDVEVKTPWAMRIPGGGARAVTVPAANLDVVPTLLGVLGVSAAGHGFEGRDLLAGGPPTPVFGAQGTLRMVVDERFKLVFDIERQSLALYDLVADPGETRDVKDANPEAVRALRRALFGWLEAREGGAGSKRSLDAAHANEQQLKSLGYIE